MGKETLYNKKSRHELEKDLKNETFSRQTLSFYKYIKLDDLDILRDKIYKSFNSLRILGRIYIANEGINAQISIPQKNIKRFEKLLDLDFNFGNIFIKEAVKEGNSFYKLIVKIKNEIVAYNVSNEEYNINKVGKHLDFEEFNKFIDNGAIVVDMRNYYESEVGRFENAIIPDVERSQELLPTVKKMLNNNKKNKILLYCTGGIRCEKASSYLIHNGFKDVNQLNGGIIKYSNDTKKNNVKSKFIGKNFVFDSRMSEPITDDIIGQCHICSEPCDRHTNCLNEHCHILIIQCRKCCKKFNNCCSKHCADFLLIDKEKRKKIFQSGKIKFNAQKSDCIKPKLKELRNI